MAVIVHKSMSSATETPYQLDVDQTLRASQALLRHVQAEAKKLRNSSSKRNLLEAETSDSEDDGVTDGQTPIWLNITTKEHIADRNRLKPSKITVPHSINNTEDISLCIITADPQRAVKDVVADPAFPSTLSSKITRIIGYTRLKERYKTFEQRRQLLSEHDLFLADDRICTRLPATLGKVFYKNTIKRPIPIRISEQNWADGKRSKPEPRTKAERSEGSGNVASPVVVATEIEKAIKSVHVNLKPGTSTAVRVGLASFSAQELSDNVAVVVNAMAEKHIAKGWRNIKSIHIKSPTSLSLPIWLADELWVEQGKVGTVEDGHGVATNAIGEAENSKRKRNPDSKNGPQSGSRKKSKVVEDPVNGDNEMVQARKSKIAAQKAKLLAR